MKKMIGQGRNVKTNLEKVSGSDQKKSNLSKKWKASTLEALTNSTTH